MSVLTGMAIAAGDVNELEVEEARRRAETRLQEKLSTEEQAAVSAALAQAALKLRIKRRQTRR